MSKLLTSKYPILCSPMNRVSEKNLAIACSKAGIFPSVISLSYIESESLKKGDHRNLNHKTPWKLDWQRFEDELIEFNNETGTNELYVSVTDSQFNHSAFQKFIDKKYFTHIEIICGNPQFVDGKLSDYDYDNFKKLQPSFNEWRNKGYKIIYKSLARFLILDILKKFGDTLFDGYVLKSANAAGSVTDRRDKNSIYEDIKYVLEEYPDAKLIVTGGIGTAQDVKDVLDAGADSIGIGTLFAASKESRLSEEAKNKMVNSTFDDVNRFTKSNQNGLVFSKIEQDDYNNTLSLEKGITTGTQGHVFAGQAVNHIKGIVSVEYITSNLVELL
tara:strand:+ start:1475 stop:2464 length:990 start_codon:yes stop_codon:yes gene_type:complete